MSENTETQENRNSPVDKNWVQFDENNEAKPHPSNTEHPPPVPAASNYNGAVIDTETVQIDIDKLKQLAQKKVPEASEQTGNALKNTTPVMRNVNLDDPDNGANNLPTILDPTIQRGFGEE